MKLCPTCNETYDKTLTFCPDDGEVLQESPQDFVGRVIDGKYQVEGFIAQGGMGAVYRARHILLGDQVVIKTLRPEMRGNAEWLKRFQREGKAARAFRHPNSVTVYDLSAGTDGLIYMVMEFVEGHTLYKELKRRGRFTPEEALTVLEPVADVLDAAHARGVVHRDLKPENIMLGSDGRGGTVVKVLDLGIAKMVGGDTRATGVTSLTMAGQILGTPYYMSPEQWGELPRDGNAEVDGRTDVYSLGVIFFELVAGRKPFSGRTLSELRQQHLTAPPPGLCEVAPDLPVAFGRSVAHAISKDRADRPPTAGALIYEARAALNLPPLTQNGGGVHAARTSGEEFSEGTTLPLISEASPGAVATKRLESGKLHKELLSRTRHRRVALALVCAAVFAAVLLGFAAWYVRKQQGSAREEIVAPTAPTIAAEAPTAEAPKVEALSYWIEINGGPAKGGNERVAELTNVLAPGQHFELHFKPSNTGFLYLVAQKSEGNAETAFVTAKGIGRWKSNKIAGGDDFSISGDIERRGGVDECTVIYSPEPLDSPAFLMGEPNHQLTAAEVKEFYDLLARYKDAAPTLDAHGEGKERVVNVSVPETVKNLPVIFKIRIEHT
ncbi:MAG TPA: serine/threonine-protein kinase [Pyrinomonadaceae bacterium]|nr:serine/threonine-protein kinase [Pyrinomonadaceae bacterium]